MAPVLLVTSTTGYQAQSFRAAAAKLQLPLVLASDRCHQLADPWQDGAIPVRFEDPAASALAIQRALAQTQPPLGVVAIGDWPAVTAAHTASALQLPFHSPRAAEVARDKFLFRERCREARLPVPRFQRLAAGSAPAAAARQASFPCVLKPLVLSASRGVIRANDACEFVDAFERIRALLQDREIRKMRAPEAEWLLVEDFVPGPEIAVEALMTRGSLRLLAIFDKPDPLDGPFFEETIYLTPSRLSAAAQREIEQGLARVVAAIGLWHGPVHAEFRLSPQGPVALECAARPIGGLCARALGFTESIGLEELLLRHAAGQPVEHIARESSASGVLMAPIPEAGVLLGVEGVEQAKQVAGIESVEITAKPGQKLLPLPEGASYLGFIFARAPSPAQVETALRQAHQQLHFVLAPELKVMRA